MKSLRARLAASSALVALAVLAVLGTRALLSVRYQARQAIVHDVATKVQEILGSIEAVGQRQEGTGLPPLPAERLLLLASERVSGVLGRAGYYVQLFDLEQDVPPAGRVGPIPYSLPTTYRQQALAGQKVSWVDTLEGGQVAVTVAPVAYRSAIIGGVAVGRSLESAQLGALAPWVATGVVVGALLVGGTAYLVAALALRPVAQMTRTVDTITASDLTARVSSERLPDEVQYLANTFNRTLERLEGAFASQRRFLADAAHELCTPATTIAGHASFLLRRTNPSSQQEGSLRALESEAQRLARLVDDLLLLARTEAQPTQVKQVVELQEVAWEVHHILALLACHRTFTLDAPQSALVLGERDTLLRMLSNLVTNAIKATKDDGQVTITLRRDGSHALLSVADNGVGIAPEHLPHLGERFYRPDRSRSRGQGGTGLGLAIVKEIIKNHGGTLHIASQLGQGSTLTIQLPLLALSQELQAES